MVIGKSKRSDWLFVIGEEVGGTPTLLVGRAGRPCPSYEEEASLETFLPFRI